MARVVGRVASVPSRTATAPVGATASRTSPFGPGPTRPPGRGRRRRAGVPTQATGRRLPRPTVHPAHAPRRRTTRSPTTRATSGASVSSTTGATAVPARPRPGGGRRRVGCRDPRVPTPIPSRPTPGSRARGPCRRGRPHAPPTRRRGEGDGDGLDPRPWRGSESTPRSQGPGRGYVKDRGWIKTVPCPQAPDSAVPGRESNQVLEGKAGTTEGRTTPGWFRTDTGLVIPGEPGLQRRVSDVFNPPSPALTSTHNPEDTDQRDFQGSGDDHPVLRHPCPPAVPSGTTTAPGGVRTRTEREGWVRRGGRAEAQAVCETSRSPEVPSGSLGPMLERDDSRSHGDESGRRIGPPVSEDHPFGGGGEPFLFRRHGSVPRWVRVPRPRTPWGFGSGWMEPVPTVGAPTEAHGVQPEPPRLLVAEDRPPRVPSPLR